MVGAHLGEEALPTRWRNDLEDAERIAGLAVDLHDIAEGRRRQAVTAAPGVGAQPPTFRSRILGCLLAGAVGDALGAPVEFDSLSEIRRRHGPEGVRTYEPVYGRLGAFTDDTQMTLFTAEGLLRAQARIHDRALCDVVGVLRRTYFRWLATQGEPDHFDAEFGGPHDGWLVAVDALNHRRAPGNTCLSALRAGGGGTPEDPINDSKGCGGVMRVAPVGLLPGDAFDRGARAAAITHGHPSGYLAAGALASIVAGVMDGETVTAAVEAAMTVLRRWLGHEETSAALAQALDLAVSAPVGPETVERLGAGWVAEEALAIAVYAAVAAPDLKSALNLAVTHSGDSDSTGAITGNILGAALGVEAVPADLLEDLEAREIITQVGSDLADVFVDGETPNPTRYPTW